MIKFKVVFICIYNFCWSQIVEVLGCYLVSDVFDSYLVGIVFKRMINLDVVWFVKECYGIDMLVNG